MQSRSVFVEVLHGGVYSSATTITLFHVHATDTWRKVLKKYIINQLLVLHTRIASASLHCLLKSTANPLDVHTLVNIIVHICEWVFKHVKLQIVNYHKIEEVVGFVFLYVITVFFCDL